MCEVGGARVDRLHHASPQDVAVERRARQARRKIPLPEIPLPEIPPLSQIPILEQAAVGSILLAVEHTAQAGGPAQTLA